MNEFFEDLMVGTRFDLGSYTFTREEIIRFAKAYDPQPFHVDEDAARRSHFGGLIASGWHTASIWMKLLVAARTRANVTMVNRGKPTPEPGPSPGFRDLKWLRPVYAGDTVTYASTLVSKRSTSRPGWGLAFHHNTGVNQLGMPAFEFTGSAFWQKRAR